jgi:predicted MPP superfamily phosphohydrolase
MEATIVHLSDLHFKNDAENQFRIRCLLEDLKRLQNDQPIHTVFTGDLVQAGDENSFEGLFEFLVGPLLELGHEVFVVPGNHDVQRSIANQSFCEKILADRTSSYLFGSSTGIRRNHPDPAFDALVNYKNFEDLFAPYEQRFYWGYTATRGSVSILGLNSSWLCCERDFGLTDRGALRVEPSIVERLAKSLPSETLRIALLHHPMDWLEETTRSAVNDLLIEHTDIVLFGHVHSNAVVGQVKQTSNCLFLQAPPLRAGWSKGTNGYAIVRGDVLHKRFEVEYRSYSQTRREFVIGVDFAANGRLFPRPEDETFFKTTPPLSGLLRRYVEADPVDYLDWYRTHIRSKSKFTGSFVIPKAYRILSGDDGPEYGQPETVTQIVGASLRDQFFVAPLDAGSTTAAYLTFKHLSETFDSHKQVPAYFDAGRETINKASILRKISQTTPLRYSHLQVEQLAADGSIVVVVDGLCLADVDQFNLFRDTADRYLPRVRFIYFLSTERRGVSPTGVGEPRLSTEQDEIYEFSQLEVDDIRSMVAMRTSDKDESVREGFVSHVVESFRQMGEPIFASTVSVIIDTVLQDPEFKPLNKARLIERYVECLLGRFDLEDVREGAFSSSDKINFLSFVARQLLEANLVGLDEKRWDKISQLYQSRFLIELPKGLMQEFLDKGLLTAEGGEITFRGDDMFSFFVAQQMKRDPNFATTLVHGRGMFRHYREITIYGELEGTNVSAVLDGVYKELSEIETTLLENYSRDGVDLTDEWRATCAEMEASVASNSLGEAATGLHNATATPESADRHDNAELAQVDRRRGVAARQEVRNAEARLLVGMQLYGLLLKNALHIEAADKLRHLRRLYDAAELWVGFMCACREVIGRYPVVIAGGVRFINFGSATDPDKSYREFKFNAPMAVSRLIAGTLRNPQLSVAIRSVMKDLSPMSQLFARNSLLEMPSSHNREAFLSSLMSEANLDVITCSLRTLRTRYLAAGRNQGRREHLEKIVASISKDSRISSRGNFMKLKKARLVEDLRRSAAESSKSNRMT